MQHRRVHSKVRPYLETYGAQGTTDCATISG